MRFYDLEVTSAAGTSLLHVSSYPQGLGGRPDPNALDLEFDTTVAQLGTPANNPATVTLWGVSPELLAQSQFVVDATNAPTLVLRGGMGGGLPMENGRASQIGTIISGRVLQVWGNWQGVEQTLSFMVAGMAAPERPLVFNWEPGQALGDALNAVLVPTYADRVTVNLANAWTRPYRVTHIAPNLNALGAFIHEQTASDPNGPVRIAAYGNRVHIYDALYTAAHVTSIDFRDLIGQPTWIQSGIMSATVVLRGDLALGGLISMPASGFGNPLVNAPGLIGFQPNAAPISTKYKTTFDATYQIQALRQIGHFRSPDGTEWATVIRATPH